MSRFREGRRIPPIKIESQRKAEGGGGGLGGVQKVPIDRLVGGRGGHALQNRLERVRVRKIRTEFDKTCRGADVMGEFLALRKDGGTKKPKSWRESLMESPFAVDEAWESEE